MLQNVDIDADDWALACNQQSGCNWCTVLRNDNEKHILEAVNSRSVSRDEILRNFKWQIIIYGDNKNRLDFCPQKYR